MNLFTMKLNSNYLLFTTCLIFFGNIAESSKLSKKTNHLNFSSRSSSASNSNSSLDLGVDFLSAIKNGDLNSIQEEIDYGANVNLKIRETPLLHIVIKSGQKDVLELLIKNNADINAIDEWKRTPILIAYLNNKTEIFDMLLSMKNIDINVENCYGETLLDYAMSRNDEETIKKLENKGGISNKFKQIKGNENISSISNKMGKKEKVILDNESFREKFYKNGNVRLRINRAPAMKQETFVDFVR